MSRQLFTQLLLEVKCHGNYFLNYYLKWLSWVRLWVESRSKPRLRGRGWVKGLDLSLLSADLRARFGPWPMPRSSHRYLAKGGEEGSGENENFSVRGRETWSTRPEPTQGFNLFVMRATTNHCPLFIHSPFNHPQPRGPDQPYRHSQPTT